MFVFSFLFSFLFSFSFFFFFFLFLFFFFFFFLFLRLYFFSFFFGFSLKDNETPLNWACLNGNVEVVSILLENDANMGVLDKVWLMFFFFFLV